MTESAAETAAETGAETVTVARRRTGAAVVAARTLFALAGAGVLATSGIAWYGVTKVNDAVQKVSIQHVQLSDGAPPPVHPHLDKSVNILLVGLDTRYAMNGDALPGDVVHNQLDAGSCSSCLGGMNANTEMILHVPANGGTPTAVSIPRDDWVEAQDGEGHSLGTMKVKEAYGNAYANAIDRAAAHGTDDVHALAKIGHAAGIKAQIATLEQLLDIPIDHFAEVNLIGFYDVAKAIGPVQVCLKRPTHDPNTNNGGSGADFPAGVFTLKTPTNAMQFVRERMDLPNGDLDRTHRQQAYITAVLKKLGDDGVLGDLSKMNSLISTAEQDVVIDDGWDLLDFAANAASLGDGGTTFRTAPVVSDTVWKWIGKYHEVGNGIDIPTVRAFVRDAFAASDATAEPADPASGTGATTPGAPGTAVGTGPATPAGSATTASTGSPTTKPTTGRPTAPASPASPSTTSSAGDNGENGGTVAGNGPDAVDGIPCVN